MSSKQKPKISSSPITRLCLTRKYTTLLAVVLPTTDQILSLIVENGQNGGRI